MSESLKLYCWTFFLWSSVNRGQQLRSGWPSKCIPFINWSTDLAHPSPNFHSWGGGLKKCEIWRRFQHHSTLSRPRLKMQKGIQTLKQFFLYQQRWSPYTLYGLAKFGEVGSTHQRAKSSITQLSITRFRSNYVHSFLAHDTRSAVKVQVNKRSKIKVTAWQRISIKRYNLSKVKIGENDNS